MPRSNPRRQQRRPSRRQQPRSRRQYSPYDHNPYYGYPEYDQQYYDPYEMERQRAIEAEAERRKIQHEKELQRRKIEAQRLEQLRQQRAQSQAGMARKRQRTRKPTFDPFASFYPPDDYVHESYNPYPDIPTAPPINIKKKVEKAKKKIFKPSRTADNIKVHSTKLISDLPQPEMPEFENDIERKLGEIVGVENVPMVVPEEAKPCSTPELDEDTILMERDIDDCAKRVEKPENEVFTIISPSLPPRVGTVIENNADRELEDWYLDDKPTEEEIAASPRPKHYEDKEDVTDTDSEGERCDAFLNLFVNLDSINWEPGTATVTQNINRERDGVTLDRKLSVDYSNSRRTVADTIVTTVEDKPVELTLTTVFDDETGIFDTSTECSWNKDEVDPVVLDKFKEVMFGAFGLSLLIHDFDSC
ncbi:hypothetical protein PCE1_004206 [Barthelona sp. PCE]